ncbi:hypothetical protein BDFB_008726 [Asbolus verrucosus]|uniref:Uncharacterized protein n=1 Tax=Asbolus verrucosus TaxID=1661398 RepID=A0A482VMT0_ASBVE|nr:hypothetical protein BDFB_008726 [Asbolus verrucosus]
MEISDTQVLENKKNLTGYVEEFQVFLSRLHLIHLKSLLIIQHCVQFMFYITKHRKQMEEITEILTEGGQIRHQIDVRMSNHKKKLTIIGLGDFLDKVNSLEKAFLQNIFIMAISEVMNPPRSHCLVDHLQLLQVPTFSCSSSARSGLWLREFRSGIPVPITSDLKLKFRSNRHSSDAYTGPLIAQESINR